MGLGWEVNVKQLVYRMERSEPFDLPKKGDVEFRVLTSIFHALPIVGILSRQLGFLSVIWIGLKLLSRKRMFFCLVHDKFIAHYGWVSVSFCRHYSVGEGDVVVGPIRTADRARGHGFATFALKCVVNRLVTDGYRVFWIDTSEDNTACQCVIRNCGFGDPVRVFDRPKEGL